MSIPVSGGEEGTLVGSLEYMLPLVDGDDMMILFKANVGQMISESTQ
jgi:hypothetical protein